MAQIAKVLALTGNAYVVGTDGLLRPLKVGDQIDKADARVSAGVQVARNANAQGKAEVVEKELKADIKAEMWELPLPDEA